MSVDNIRRDDWLLAGVALLPVVDLLFLPWFDLGIGPISVTSTATGTPDGWLGMVAVLAALALITGLRVERLAPGTRVPAVSGSCTTTRLALSAVTALFVALKFLFHIHFNLFGVGFWAAVVLTAGLVVLVARAHRGRPLMPAQPTAPVAPVVGPAPSAGQGSQRPPSAWTAARRRSKS
jgi:hypothetical protein